MEREDQFLVDRFGRETPFRVPDGYFEDFASLMMQKLPEKNERATTPHWVVMKASRWHRWRPIAVVAACVCAAVFGVGVYLHSNTPGVAESHVRVANGVSPVSFSAVDAIADYAMLDAEDMYAYMEDAE